MVNMSALPQLKPIKISDLQQRYTRAHITQNYDRIAHGVVITKAEQTADAPFQHDIISRARAHHLNNPEAIVSHWAAAAYAGLTYWANEAQVTLLVESGRHTSHSRLQPHRQAKPAATATWTPDPAFPMLRCVTPALATIQCIKDVVRGNHTWFVHRVPGLAPEEIRSIQLIDAMRRCTGITPYDVLSSGYGIISARTLQKLISLSDPQADSPQETTLRLIAFQVHDGLSTQIPIYARFPEGGYPRLLTQLDAGWRAYKVGLFYDGLHHLDRRQRDYDSMVTIQLHNMGWDTLRITHGMLYNARELQRNIAAKINLKKGMP